MKGPTILVLGPGQAAVDAAMEVRDQGVRAVLVRPKGPFAGPSGELDGIDVRSDHELLRLEGGPGNFRAVLVSSGKVEEVPCSAVVMAGEPLPPTPSGRADVITLHQACGDGLPDEVERLAIVLGPDAERSSFSRAVDLAIKACAHPAHPRVWLFSEEMLAYGEHELSYADAQAAGTTFVRTNGPVTIITGPLTVSALDVPSELPVNIHPDLLVLDGVPDKVDRPRSWPAPLYGGISGHVSMGPVATMREGVFVCSTIEGGLLEGETSIRAKAAAARAVTLAMNPPVRSVAVVDRDKCSACLTCARICPFLAARPGDEGKAVIDSTLCQACGVCVGGCPSRALSLPEDKTLGSGTDLGEGGE